MSIGNAKVAIISDTHDNIPNIEKALSWINKEGIETLLHCGDISTKETMDLISKNFKGKIFAVFGNMDINSGEDWKFKNVKIFPEICEIKLGKKKIAFVHKPELAEKLAESGKYDIVFYGHTHKPWLDSRIFSEGGKEKSCFLVNPGNLAGMFYKATFAVYDTKTNKLELKILERL